MDQNLSTRHLIQSFIGSSFQLNKALKQYGFTPRQFLDPTLTQLKHIDSAKLQLALQNLQVFKKILAHAEMGQMELWETSNLLELTFSELKLTYSDDFVTTIEHDDIVDGYDLNNCQIFRNFRFMEICSYDLHDIVTYDWPTLFERSQMITSKIMEKVEEVVRTGRTVSLEDVPAHYMKERHSQDGSVFRVKFRHMGPIFAKAGVPAGFLASSKAEIIDETPSRHELRFI